MGRKKEAEARYRAIQARARAHPDPLLTTKQQSQNAENAKAFLWIGRILHVDVETMVCSVQMESGQGIYHDVPIPGPGGAGPRSWSGLIPEHNSRALIGWNKVGDRNHKPYIITYWTVGVRSAREYEPFSTVDPADAAILKVADPDLNYFPEINLGVVRLKARKAYSGDWIATSSGGAHAQLDKDAYIVNRANNEFRLRDADQTTIHQTINEFTSNAAGYYRRGLIKRNAFNFHLDLGITTFNPFGDDSFDEFVSSRFTTGIENQQYTLLTKLDSSSPAYQKLRDFKLINEDGTPVFPSDPDDLNYPYVVTPDGQRISYIVRGEQDVSFDATNECFTEDRLEMRHVSDGIMAVTEEGDGFQIDKVADEIFIEDVKGTVVGNDPYTDAGRERYRKILRMKAFNNDEQTTPSGVPILEPIDMVKTPALADSVALARYFTIRSPTSGNQFSYGISKEGQMFLHVPKAITGETRGRSLDANFVGGIKAILGTDAFRKSVDLITDGAIKAKLGVMPDDNPDNPIPVSVDMEVDGAIKIKFNGPVGIQQIVEGSDSKFCSSQYAIVAAEIVLIAQGGGVNIEGTSVSQIAGDGGYKVSSGGDYGLTVLGKSSIGHAQLVTSNFAVGKSEITIAGVDATTVFSGGITRSVTAGTGIADTVGVGNYTNTVGTGNIALSVGTGNFSAAVGAGNVALSTGAGTATLSSSTSTAVVGGAAVTVLAPTISLITVAPVGNLVAGVPGPPGPHRDYITGLPILGLPTITVG